MKTDLKWRKPPNNQNVEFVSEQYITDTNRTYTVIVIRWHGKIGIAVCSPTDEFNLTTGINQAIQNGQHVTSASLRAILYKGNRRIIDYVNELAVISPFSVPHIMRRYLREKLSYDRYAIKNAAIFNKDRNSAMRGRITEESLKIKTGINQVANDSQYVTDSQSVADNQVRIKNIWQLSYPNNEGDCSFDVDYTVFLFTDNSVRWTEGKPQTFDFSCNTGDVISPKIIDNLNTAETLPEGRKVEYYRYWSHF